MFAAFHLLQEFEVDRYGFGLCELAGVEFGAEFEAEEEVGALMRGEELERGDHAGFGGFVEDGVVVLVGDVALGEGVVFAFEGGIFADIVDYHADYEH